MGDRESNLTVRHRMPWRNPVCILEIQVDIIINNRLNAHDWESPRTHKDLDRSTQLHGKKFCNDALRYDKAYDEGLCYNKVSVSMRVAMLPHIHVQKYILTSRG